MEQAGAGRSGYSQLWPRQRWSCRRQGVPTAPGSGQRAPRPHRPSAGAAGQRLRSCAHGGAGRGQRRQAAAAPTPRAEGELLLLCLCLARQCPRQPSGAVPSSQPRREPGGTKCPLSWHRRHRLSLAAPGGGRGGAELLMRERRAGAVRSGASGGACGHGGRRRQHRAQAQPRCAPPAPPAAGHGERHEPGTGERCGGLLGGSGGPCQGGLCQSWRWQALVRWLVVPGAGLGLFTSGGAKPEEKQVGSKPRSCRGQG